MAGILLFILVCLLKILYKRLSLVCRIFFCFGSCVILNSLPVTNDLSSSAQIFANRLDPDLARQNVLPDLDPHCMMTLMVFIKEFFEKKIELKKKALADKRKKNMPNYQACKEVKMKRLPGPQIRVCNSKLFSYFSTKAYVVGTHKNPKHMFKLMDRKIITLLC